MYTHCVFVRVSSRNLKKLYGDVTIFFIVLLLSSITFVVIKHLTNYCDISFLFKTLLH